MKKRKVPRAVEKAKGTGETNELKRTNDAGGEGEKSQAKKGKASPPKSAQTETATAAAVEALSNATAKLEKAVSAAAGAVAAASDAQALEDGVTDQGGLGSCAYPSGGRVPPPALARG